MEGKSPNRKNSEQNKIQKDQSVAYNELQRETNTNT